MNKNLFGSAAALPADTKNAAGGRAYSLGCEEALAQLACTGTLADAFYTDAKTQLDELLAQAAKCDDAYVAQVAVYARHKGFMKDTPAVLLAYLFGKKSEVLTESLFRTVIDNAKMLSNFVQAVRSGKLGRRSLGTKGARLVGNWINSRPLDYLFRQSIAKDPSLADIIKLARPNSKLGTGNVVDRHQRGQLYRFLLGKEHVEADLPQLVKDVLKFRAAAEMGVADDLEVPRVPFNMVDSVPLTTKHWRELFTRGGLQFTRMNLRTAARQGVFGDTSMRDFVVQRFRDEAAIQKSRQFPYQWLMAYSMVHGQNDVPAQVTSALIDAMELSTKNVPSFDGEVYVAVDMSGSMTQAVTGNRGRSTTSVTCAGVAALFAACLTRTSPNVTVMTFADSARYVPVQPRDTIATIAQQLSRAGGGTDMSSPLRQLNDDKRKVDLFVSISDNESWLDSGYYGRARGLTGTVEAWAQLKRRCPNARQVRINIQPGSTDQLPKRDDTLKVGGFSDMVFEVMAAWLASGTGTWVDKIRQFVVS